MCVAGGASAWTAAGGRDGACGFAAPPVWSVESLVYLFDYEAHGITVGCFLVDVPPAWEPRLNDEHDEYRWCSRDDAVELLYWPEPKELLRPL